MGRLLVVELGGAASGAYAAKQFADFGAEVHALGARPDGPGAAFYDTSKHLHREVDGPEAATLLATADVVIQSSAVDAIEHPIQAAHPAQIVVQVSPFGADGPYSSWRSTDLVDVAIAGHLRLTGDPEREPLQGVPDIVHHAAGMIAFISALAALVARVRTGRGQTAATSHHETIAALHQFTLCRYTHNGAILNRLGNRYAGPGTPIGAYECADGWIGLALPQEDQVERMLEVTGLISLLERDDVSEIIDLMVDTELLDSELRPYLRTQNRDETVELFQLLRLPCAPVSDMDDLVDDPHLAARDFWVEGEVDGEAIALPGRPMHATAHDWSIGPKHRSGELPERGEPTVDLADGPLTGFRVIDMTRVWAGPLATRILADLGAEVLMTEVPWTRTPKVVAESYVQATHFFPDDDAGERGWNRSGFHNKYANNKLSTVIELDKPEGRDLFADLIPTADVLVENYSPRVMPGFGFDEARLHELNPDLVYVTMPGYGREGPNTDWVAYGPTIDGHVGHTALTGYLDEGPWKCGIAWPDPIGGMHGAAAALIGLLDRLVGATDDEHAPRGQTFEVAQIESAINMIGQHVVAAQRSDEPTRRWGNRRPGRAPQGVYRCLGDDRWIAISVVDDAAWRGLCGVAGWHDLVDLDDSERWARHDELDGRLTEFTQGRDDLALMAELQEAGVPAGAVTSADDVLGDPQLAALDFFVELHQVDAGTHPWPRFPGRLSLTPPTLRLPSALMGEHNDYAVLNLAGRSQDDYDQLRQAGVVRDDPPF